MTTVRVLILGTGGMASQHVKLLRQDGRAAIVAACDVDGNRAKAFADLYGIAQSFGSLDDALAWGEFDAVMNVTPDAVHHPTTMVLLGAAKHVLCEKPLAQNVTLAREMAEAAAQAGVVNMVNLSYRNVAGLEEARKRIAAGEIGEVRHVEASYRQSWLVGNAWGDWRTDPKWLWRLSEKHGSKGVLGDVGIHILDFACHAIGLMPVSLQARLKTFHKAAGDKIDDYPLDANDSAVMSVEFSNGALGVIHASRFMTGYGNDLKLAVFGDKGGLELHHGMAWTELRICSGDDVNTFAWRQVPASEVENNHRRFITAVIARQAVEPSFAYGAALQQIMDSCQAPAATGAEQLG